MFSSLHFAPGRILRIVVLFFCVLLAACAPLSPKAVGVPVTQDFAAALMQGWIDSSAGVTSVQGLAKVKVRAHGQTMSGSQVLLAEQPDHLRAETLSPFGSPLLILAADGERLGVLLPGENTYYQGAATATNLGRFVRIPLALPDLLGVLLYRPPLIVAQHEAAYTFAPPEEGWLLVRSQAALRQELAFNLARQLVEVRYYDHDELFLKVNYEKFQQVGAFPSFFGLELPGDETTASLEFSDLQTNGPLPSGIFQLSPPPGVKIVSLDE